MAANPVTIPDLRNVLHHESAALREQTIRQEQILDGHFLKVHRDTVLLPGGKTATREFVRHPGAVVVVPLLPDGRYLVERQYRHPMGRLMIEFPAGKLDANEPGLQCAMRELQEETGFHARQWAYAGVMHNCIGYSDEHIDIWFARDLVAGTQCLEDGELLHLCAASLDELLECARTGQLTDAKTLTCLLWLQQAAQGAWPLHWQVHA